MLTRNTAETCSKIVNLIIMTEEKPRTMLYFLFWYEFKTGLLQGGAGVAQSV